ncbi:MAG TPA: Na/Pi symporter [Cyclobacteriaceae bacterium]|nr:Na/Pi symporter [Cyclobacteriaceae bacterium]
MPQPETNGESLIKTDYKTNLLRLTYFLFGLFLFVFSLDLLSTAFRFLGRDAAESFIFLTANPFIALFIGLLMTAILQSSSSSTSIIVAAVASGTITYQDAIPMAMGANIGTTITSTIVSLGFITDKNEFRRALAAGTVHDFFNIFTAALLFPLEYYFGVLSGASAYITSALFPEQTNGTEWYFGLNLFGNFFLKKWILAIIPGNFILVIIAALLVFASIWILSRLIYKTLIGGSTNKLRKFIFKNPFKSFFWGTTLTAAVQSSSITTSLMVPLVATRAVKLNNATPFILGANLGTTITALLAAIIKSQAAINLAFAHILFNVTGILIFLSFKITRNFLVGVAKTFGKLTIQFRLIGFLYIVVVFFMIPFSLIYFNKNITDIQELNYIKFDYVQKTEEEFKVISKAFTNKRLGEWQLAGTDDYDENLYLVNSVYRRKNVLFFNNEVYLLNKIGYCWDDEDGADKFKLCIQEILPVYTLPRGQQIDSVYVYEKVFYDQVKSDSIKSFKYVSPVQNVLVKKERYNKAGELIYKEELQSFTKN